MLGWTVAAALLLSAATSLKGWEHFPPRSGEHEALCCWIGIGAATTLLALCIVLWPWRGLGAMATTLIAGILWLQFIPAFARDYRLGLSHTMGLGLMVASLLVASLLLVRIKGYTLSWRTPFASDREATGTQSGLSEDQ